MEIKRGGEGENETKKRKEKKTKYLNQNIFVWNIPREQEICLSLPILQQTTRWVLHEDASETEQLKR